MARAVDGPLPAAQRRYPWEQWSDGQVWELTRGEDFEVTAGSFRDTARGWAREHGYTARTYAVSDAVVQVQFTKREA
jgi:hypothetical protein